MATKEKTNKTIDLESLIEEIAEETAEKIEEPKIKTKFEAYNGDEPYLFVSYSHRDTNKVYPILDELSDNKYRIWYDEACENGNDFRDELRQRIKNSEAVLRIINPHGIVRATRVNRNIRACFLEIFPKPEHFSRCVL